MQDRVLGDVSWTRGQCQKHECHSQQADVHGFEPPARTRRMARWRRRTLPFPHRTRSPRALTPRKVDGTRPPDQRWASADLSQGPAHKSRPGLFTRQGPGSVVSSLAFPPRSPTSQLRPLSFFLCRITFSFLFYARLSKPTAVSLTAESPPHKSRSPTRRAGRL